ncbi:hypothetical protein OG785_04185 [Streptomyces sp. NBC_00006]|uniref:transposase n=1 Tax=Streptomyces sp. NBC_00006 TaxID=2975619 RepID=UPI002251E825|nr:transposase [Streptomyces sp. NBC_00006]MCX5529761.1 hypothetical protein [Streptomyces sp. NBC_00006]
MPPGHHVPGRPPIPARQLAALYAERWEIEAVFADLKPHQRGAKAVLSSKTPDRVLQQIWAHLLVHHTPRELMLETATARQLDPGRVSFTETLRSARRSVTLTTPVTRPKTSHSPVCAPFTIERTPNRMENPPMARATRVATSMATTQNGAEDGERQNRPVPEHAPWGELWCSMQAGEYRWRGGLHEE